MLKLTLETEIFPFQLRGLWWCPVFRSFKAQLLKVLSGPRRKSVRRGEGEFPEHFQQILPVFLIIFSPFKIITQFPDQKFSRGMVQISLYLSVTESLWPWLGESNWLSNKNEAFPNNKTSIGCNLSGKKCSPGVSISAVQYTLKFWYCWRHLWTPLVRQVELKWFSTLKPKVHNVF